MGLALLVGRDEVYRLHLVILQSNKPRMGVTLLGCFNILKFEIDQINIYDLVQNKNGLSASYLARCGLYNVDCLWSDSKRV